MALSKDRKKDVISQYKRWLRDGQAVFVTEYIGLTMKDMDRLRNQVREVGGEFHVVKNTLGKLVFQDMGLDFTDTVFVDSTAVTIAYEDAPAMAKVLKEFARDSEFLKVKIGYLGGKMLTAEDVLLLADLPTLPVMRTILLGTILAPASKLVRTIHEPGRQIAAVIKAFTDQAAAITPA